MNECALALAEYGMRYVLQKRVQYILVICMVLV